MRRLSLALAALLLTAAAAWAALPPEVQQEREVNAILAHSAVKAAFKDRPIEAIEVIDWDLYRLTAGTCHMDVAIRDQPDAPAVTGPRLFYVEPGPLVCEGE